MLASLRANKKFLLIAILTIETTAVFYWRLPLTKSPLISHYEYQLAQITISTENWMSEGIGRRSAVPSRSIDQDIPDWTSPDQNYFSTPPLAFLIHYGLRQLFPNLDPILAAKLIGHFAIYLTSLIVGILLLPILGFWLSNFAVLYFMSSKAVSVWMIDGYFPPTLSLCIFFILIAFAANKFYLAIVARSKRISNIKDFLIFYILGFLASFSEYLGVFALTVVSAAFVLFAIWGYLLNKNYRDQAKDFLALVASSVAGALTGLLTMAALYSGLNGFEFFKREFFLRAFERVGGLDGPVSLLEHLKKMRFNFFAGWPPYMYNFITKTAIAVFIGLVIFCFKKSKLLLRRESLLFVLILLTAFAPSIAYHLTLKNLVRMHYWFTASWVVFISLLLAITLLLVSRLIAQNKSARLISVGIVIIGSLFFVKQNFLAVRNSMLLQLSDASQLPYDLYRDIGQLLPKDHFPIISINLEEYKIPMNFPYAPGSMYRPVLVFENDSLQTIAHKKNYDWEKLARENVYLLYKKQQLNCPGKQIAADFLNEHSLSICLAKFDRVEEEISKLIGK